MLQNIKRISFNFARKLVRRIRKNQAQHSNLPIREDQSSKEIEQNIEQDIEPLTYNKKVQQELRMKVTEQLGSYDGEDPSPHKLVNRPSKGAAWGLGGQLMLASKRVQLQGLKAQSDAIIEFLQLQQVKNIYLHDFFADNPERRQTNRRRYHILGSCFSAKHCWKVGLQLKNAFNLNSGKTRLWRKHYDPVFAVLNGGKDEEWVMVEYKDYDVSLMTEEQREAIDLQWKWNNPVAEDVLDKHMEMKVNKKGRKKQYQDLD